VPIGELQNQNDTPIGGTAEYRGNMQNGDAFNIADVPVWDGSKFAPGSATGLLTGYGGLASSLSPGHVADGSLMGDWDASLPIAGSPQQVTVDTALGTVTPAQTGVYEVSFSANVANLANNQQYEFVLNVDGSGISYCSIIIGSNNVNSQVTTFNLTANVGAGLVIAVEVFNAGSNTFDVVTASLTVLRIG
jgi:hypothetical protein